MVLERLGNGLEHGRGGGLCLGIEGLVDAKGGHKHAGNGNGGKHGDRDPEGTGDPHGRLEVGSHRGNEVRKRRA